MKKRPLGLTIFAIINLFFAASSLLSIFLMVNSPQVLNWAGLSLSPYAILSPLLTSILLIVSGVGFFTLSYRAGFLGGITFCIFSLGNIIVFNALRGFQDFSFHIPSMIYPLVMLFMLTFKYRQTFLQSSGTTMQPPLNES